MKYIKEKIILCILLIEIVAGIFLWCFYSDMYQATLNGRSEMDAYGNVTFTPAESWSVSLQEKIEDIKAIFEDEA